MSGTAAPRISFLAREDVDACAAIAQTAPDPWTRENLCAMLEADFRLGFAAKDEDGQVLGFACFFLIADSADLEMICVHPTARKRGVGRALLLHALPLVAARGARRVLLEVRASNAPAIALYRALGFKTLATRPGMYGRPKEDGLMMAINVSL